MYPASGATSVEPSQLVIFQLAATGFVVVSFLQAETRIIKRTIAKVILFIVFILSYKV
jgi:hypothetical protein